MDCINGNALDLGRYLLADHFREIFVPSMAMCLCNSDIKINDKLRSLAVTT